VDRRCHAWTAAGAPGMGAAAGLRSLSHGDRASGRRPSRQGHEGSGAGPRAARLLGGCGRLSAAARRRVPAQYLRVARNVGSCRGAGRGARRATGRPWANCRARVLAGRDLQPADGRVCAGHQGGGGVLSGDRFPNVVRHRAPLGISGRVSCHRVALPPRVRRIERRRIREDAPARLADDLRRIGPRAGPADSRCRRYLRPGGGIEASRACAQGSGARGRAHRRPGCGARVQLQAAGTSPQYVGRDTGLAAKAPVPT